MKPRAPRARAPKTPRSLGPVQSLTILGVLVALALCAGAVVGILVLLHSFRRLEIESMQQKATQVYRAFTADLGQLALSDRDYAEWDSASAFISDHNTQFIEANFTRETLDGMHIDLVRIIGEDGQDLFSCQLDRANGEIRTPADLALSRSLPSVNVDAAVVADTQVTSRLVATSAGLAAVAATRITLTNRTAPTGAVMLFTRFIGAQDLERVRQTSQLPVTLAFLPKGAGDLANRPEALRRWAASVSLSAQPLVLTSGGDTATGYVLIRDDDGAPLALLSTSAARSIYALGVRTTVFVIVALALIIGTLGSAAAWLLWRLQRSHALHRDSELRYRLIAAQLQEGIVLVDAATLQVIEANEAVLRALQCSHSEIRGKRIQDVFPDIPASTLTAVAGADGQRELLISRLGSGAEASHAEVAVSGAELHGRRMLMLVGRDVSHRQHAVERDKLHRRKLMHLAEHDPLTKLPNRLFLHRRLTQAIRKLSAGDRLLALIYVDIDHFKNINDSRGHGIGDQLLQVVASRMRAALGPQDMIARMGGDEFVAVATLLPDMRAVRHTAELLLTAMRAPVMLEGEAIAVTASIGVALYPSDALDADTLLKYADIALYIAKEAGRDCYRMFSAQMDVRVSEEVALEQALRHAKGTEQIFVEYQPIIDMRTGLVTSLEALVRWRHPTLGLVPPSELIRVAEKSGMIIEIGQQVLQIVVARLRGWLDELVPIVPIAVNVSPLQFDRSDFASLVAQTANASAVDPKWLCFEVTESAAMKDPSRLIDTLHRLRALGSRILLDDFGTGFSNLSYLNQLPIDTLKIDRAFVRGLDPQNSGQSVIHAVVDIARRLKMTVVCEGIENAEQAKLVRELGCDFGQGYFYSKPVSARHCRALLAQLRLDRPLTATVLVRTLPEDTSVISIRRQESQRLLDKKAS
jgi:diguanylate cyclase (GGDEF)-like protein